MAIALFGISNIYHGIHKFMNATAQLQNVNALGIPQTTHNMAKQQRALRVLRVSELGETPQCAGRMVISGRMADVCAELDRLVALEAKNKPFLPH